MSQQDKRELYRLAQRVHELHGTEYKHLCNLWVRRRHELRHSYNK